MDDVTDDVRPNAVTHYLELVAEARALEADAGHGRPPITWCVEAGDPEMLAVCAQLHARVFEDDEDPPPLSARWIRWWRRKVLEYLRDHAVDEFAPRPCDTCGETFAPTSLAGRRYCSNKCRQRAYRRRRKDLELELGNDQQRKES